MGNKIQGEGDYEAARRFNKAEQDFVKRKYRKREALDELDSDDLQLDADTNESVNADDDTIIASNVESQDSSRSRSPDTISRR